MTSTQPEMKNAKITYTKLGFGDHGEFTYDVGLDYGGIHQTMGGWGLNALMMGTSIQRILQVVGVRSWEELPGKYVRVKTLPNKVVAIYNILDETKKFSPEETFIELQNGQATA